MNFTKKKILCTQIKKQNLKIFLDEVEYMVVILNYD